MNWSALLVFPQPVLILTSIFHDPPTLDRRRILCNRASLTGEHANHFGGCCAPVSDKNSTSSSGRR